MTHGRGIHTGFQSSEIPARRIAMAFDMGWERRGPIQIRDIYGAPIPDWGAAPKIPRAWASLYAECVAGLSLSA